MASYTVVAAKHQTLGAGTVDTVTLNGAQSITVQNRGAADIYFTIAAPGATPPTPVAAADDTYICAAGSVVFASHPESSLVGVVKLISTGAPAYSVMGF